MRQEKKNPVLKYFFRFFRILPQLLITFALTNKITFFKKKTKKKKHIFDKVTTTNEYKNNSGFWLRKVLKI